MPLYLRARGRANLTLQLSERQLGRLEFVFQMSDLFVRFRLISRARPYLVTQNVSLPQRRVTDRFPTIFPTMSNKGTRELLHTNVRELLDQRLARIAI